MIPWIFLIIQLLLAVVFCFVVFFLIRFILKIYNNKNILKIIGFSLLTLIAIFLAIFFILAVIGGLSLSFN